ncbi:MAG: glycogen synthase GlgA [Pseudomonadota bacterium]
MTRVLSVASECVPLVKTGGLADVAGALPKALAPIGVEMRTLLPGYRPVLKAVGKAKKIASFPALYRGEAVLREVTHAGLRLYILDAPHLFDRDGSPYLDASGRDFADNAERFAALSWVAAEIAVNGAAGWLPDVLHCHDWQAGFAPYFAKKRSAAAKSIFTIHNMAFQGNAPAEKIEALGLDRADFTEAGFEYWGQASAMKAALVSADRITTVSPTYAREVTSPEFGFGMEGILTARQADLSGILNGIDLDVWDPATDPEVANYKTPRGKARAKTALRREFGLPNADGPLCVVVSRLSHQKGLDVLLDALPALADNGGQLALLGSGDPALEAAYRRAAEHPNVAVKIGYDEALSHRMMAGGDAVLVPSRFEPCGLTQLYGLRYGTLPVVALTGGLVDTVIHASPMALRSGVATGVQFAPVTAHALAGALLQTVALHRDGPTWSTMQRNAMKQVVDWGASATEYASLYNGLTGAA